MIAIMRSGLWLAVATALPVGLLRPAMADQELTTTDCDRLAADPFDHERVSDPVTMKDMRSEIAQKACREAVENFPDEPRFQHQYGRALGAGAKYRDAMSMYLRAAEKNYAAAFYMIGALHQYGHGVDENLSEALIWYHKAAKKGHARSQTVLGFEHYVGRVLAKDYKLAFEWTRLAAERGDPMAQTSLGDMYEHGPLMPHDYEEAAKLYEMAANQGFMEGQQRLGWMYEAGKGVPKDFIRAHMWYNLAAAQGGERAAERRDIVAKAMTPADISKAQKMAREWKPKK